MTTFALTNYFIFINRQILKMLVLHNGHVKLMMIGLRALSHLLQSGLIWVFYDTASLKTFLFACILNTVI